jgi:hypothetical protein
MEKLKLSTPLRPSHQNQKWQPPPENIYKINCDGVFLQDTKKEDGDASFVIIKANS